MSKDPYDFIEIPFFNRELKGFFIPVHKIKDGAFVYWLCVPTNMQTDQDFVIS